MKCLSDHFKVKKNVPLARQKLLASKPNPGDTISNFVTRLKSFAEHCDYGEQEDNQTEVRAIKERRASSHDRANVGDAKDCKVSLNHTCSKCEKRGHMEVFCHTKQDKHCKGRGKSGRRKREGVRNIGDQPDQGDVEGSEASEDDGFYVFSASDGKQELLETDRKIYVYASQQPLKLNGKCMLNICLPNTQTSLKAEFFVVLDTADTLLGRSSFEELDVLKVGISVNAFEFKDVTDKKAAPKGKVPSSVYWFWKIETFSMKTVDESDTPVAQATGVSTKQHINFSVDKLQELEELDVIENVNGPTS
ncbi:hypothetical protein ACROYT_G038347 [Oculina patagonica]